MSTVMIAFQPPTLAPRANPLVAAFVFRFVSFCATHLHYQASQELISEGDSRPLPCATAFACLLQDFGNGMESVAFKPVIDV
jgi:hypothetical protein